MKRKRFTIAIITLAVLVVAGVAVAVIIKNKSDTRTATGYEDENGWVYSCSKPVKVKDQGATYGNGEPSLTPVDPSDAAKYCHRIGIE